jgi:hypothetical protein
MLSDTKHQVINFKIFVSGWLIYLNNIKMYFKNTWWKAVGSIPVGDNMAQ